MGTPTGIHRVRKPRGLGAAHAAQEKMIPVDLSEMAEFIAVVQNRFVFLTCVSRCQLQFVGQLLGGEVIVPRG